MTLLLTSFATTFLALVAVRVAMRRDPAGASLLTQGSILLLLALPLLAVIPKVPLAVPVLASATMSSPGPGLAPLGWLWAAGCAVVALRFLLDHIALARWMAHATPCRDSRLQKALAACRRQLALRQTVRLRIHPHISSPSVAGLFRPVIVLPRSARAWSDDTVRMVLLHELGHLARRDLWAALAARLACLLHWFNPLAWILRRRLMAQCEFACDTFVIAHGANPAVYATALCDVAEEAGGTPAAALAMAGPAPLRQRVERLVRTPRSGTPFLVVTALLFTVTAAVALSVVRFQGNLPAAIRPVDDTHLRLTANPFPGG